jgi:hypothetical protein
VVESGIAVASTSLIGVGGVTSMLGLVLFSLPGGMGRIQEVRTEAMIAKIRGVKRDHVGVRSWKKRAYWRHAGSLWCGAFVVVLWERILEAWIRLGASFSRKVDDWSKEAGK